MGIDMSLECNLYLTEYLQCIRYISSLTMSSWLDSCCGEGLKSNPSTVHYPHKIGSNVVYMKTSWYSVTMGDIIH